jgi:nucleotide-binding universal stress UspA family protein
MKVLLAMDTSEASQAAAREVSGRPWPADSSIEVVSVVEPSPLWTTSEVAGEAVQHAQETVQRAVEQLKSSGLETTAAVLSGDSKTLILDLAAKSSADFVVVGSHGASALEGFLLGNVAAAVLRYAPCSVEVVRAKPGAQDGGMRVLLATDGSECSELAARSLAERPWPAGTEVRVLNVVQLILSNARAFLELPFGDSAPMEQFRAEAMKRAQDAIAAAVRILSSAGLATSEYLSVLLTGTKAVILDQAMEWNADLIVLGSHGHRGVDRFLLGSVSEAVALHARCSVEIIRRRRSEAPEGSVVLVAAEPVLTT